MCALAVISNVSVKIGYKNRGATTLVVNCSKKKERKKLKKKSGLSFSLLKPIIHTHRHRKVMAVHGRCRWLFSSDLLTARRRKKRGVHLYTKCEHLCVYLQKRTPPKKKKSVFFGRGRAVMEDQREYRSPTYWGRSSKTHGPFLSFSFPRLSSIRECE